MGAAYFVLTPFILSVILLSVFVCVVVCVCAHICVCVCVRVCMGVRGQCQVFSSVSLHSPLLTHSARLAGQWAQGCSCAHIALPQALVTMFSFYVGLGDLNAGPQACAARPLPTESCPSPTCALLFPDCLLHVLLTQTKSLYSDLSKPRDLGSSFSPPSIPT